MTCSSPRAIQFASMRAARRAQRSSTTNRGRSASTAWLRKPRARATRLRTGSVMRYSSTGPRAGPTREGLTANRTVATSRRPDDGFVRSAPARRRPAGSPVHPPRHRTAMRRSRRPASSRLTLATPRSAASPCLASMCVVACRPCAAAAMIRPPIWSARPAVTRLRMPCATGISTSSRSSRPCGRRPWPAPPRFRPAASPAGRREPGQPVGAAAPALSSQAVIGAAGTTGLALDHPADLLQRRAQRQRRRGARAAAATASKPRARLVPWSPSPIASSSASSWAAWPCDRGVHGIDEAG